MDTDIVVDALLSVSVRFLPCLIQVVYKFLIYVQVVCKFLIYVQVLCKFLICVHKFTSRRLF